MKRNSKHPYDSNSGCKVELGMIISNCRGSCQQEVSEVAFCVCFGTIVKLGIKVNEKKQIGVIGVKGVPQ